jgi:ADP-ribose pyrophosphatase YjhB (NUDIX family)
MARYDTAYTTVDLAIFNDVGDRILLGRKEDEDYWRLPGGFATPGSETFEADCRRECQEETSVSITDPIYVSSHKVDDWRYRGERDVIKTLLFKARKQFGDARAGDDLHEVRWFDFDQIDLADIAPNHQILIKSLREDRKREQDRAADFAVLEKFLKDKGADAEILAIANKLGGER